MGILGVWSGQRFRAGLRSSKRLACAGGPRVGTRSGMPARVDRHNLVLPAEKKQLAADEEHGWGMGGQPRRQLGPRNPQTASLQGHEGSLDSRPSNLRNTGLLRRVPAGPPIHRSSTTH
jgi:hypothetical protein